MSSRRVARVGELIVKELGLLLVTKVKDPRLAGLNITGVKVTPDLKRATVFYSLFDPHADRAAVARALEKSAGFFKANLGRALTMKFTPELVFRYDEAVDYGRHMDEVLSQIAPASEAGENHEEEDEDRDGD